MIWVSEMNKWQIPRFQVAL